MAYNTWLVVVSSALLGIGAGLAGCFLLLRKRSLMGDALSHATLPGIAGAFLIMVALGGSGKALGGLLLGATLSGTLGFLALTTLQRQTRLKEDAAMGIVLSVFFGAGVALLGIVRQVPGGNGAGLEGFIYGKAASMVAEDLWFLSIAAVVVAVVAVLALKELRLIAFDEAFAASLGWPVVWLDRLLLGLITVVTVVGLHAVGLILVIAFLILPAATARCWTDRLGPLLAVAAGVGALSGSGGAWWSAQSPDLPAGAIMVLTATSFFAISVLISPQRGLIAAWWRGRTLRQRVGLQHLLRALYELAELELASTATVDGPSLNDAPSAPTASRSTAIEAVPVAWADLSRRRFWAGRLPSLIAQAKRRGLLESCPTAGGTTGGTGTEREPVRFTTEGCRAAARAVRNHRLWELYLIEYADIAPSHVDRDADMVEHLLDPEIVRRLEQQLWPHLPPAPAVPGNPHRPGLSVAGH